MGFFAKLAQLITGTDAATPRTTGVNFKTSTTRDLIRKESQIGAKLFGPIPKGHRREFFCLDEHTWVWYEEWLDANKKQQSATTRYEVHPNGVIKVQDGHPYQNVEGAEFANLMTAIELYYEQVLRGVYRYDPTTGKPLQESATIKK